MLVRLSSHISIDPSEKCIRFHSFLCFIYNAGYGPSSRLSLSISLSSPWHKVGVYVLRLWQPLFPLAAVFNTSPGPGGAFSYLFSSVVFYSSSTSLVSQISQYMYVLSMILLDLLYIFFFSTLAGCNDHTCCLLPWPYLHIARASC